MDWLRRWWGAVIAIMVTVTLLVIWGIISDEQQFTPTETIGVNLIITAIGLFASFIAGDVRRGFEISEKETRLADLEAILIRKEEQQLSKENQLRTHAKDRCRHLHRLAETLNAITRSLMEIENLPELSESERQSPKLQEYKRTSSYVVGQTEICFRSIRDCLNFWQDYAPQEIEELNEQLIDGRGISNDFFD